MIDIPALLARRPWVPERTLLDCLELAQWLCPLIGGPEPPRITSAQLEARWQCSQPTANRRIHALRIHRLIDASLYPGRHAFWVVRRVGVES
jgi:hypothetical protein